MRNFETLHFHHPHSQPVSQRVIYTVYISGRRREDLIIRIIVRTPGSYKWRLIKVHRPCRARRTVVYVSRDKRKSEKKKKSNRWYVFEASQRGEKRERLYSRAIPWVTENCKCVMLRFARNIYCIYVCYMCCVLGKNRGVAVCAPLIRGAFTHTPRTRRIYKRHDDCPTKRYLATSLSLFVYYLHFYYLFFYFLSLMHEVLHYTSQLIHGIDVFICTLYCKM